MTPALAYRFDHVHVYASDFAASERWFVEGLGAEVLERTEAPAPSAVLGLGNARVLLRPANAGETLAQAGPSRFGTDHLGLLVDDLEATAAELKRRGVVFSMEPKQLRPGLKISFVTGPDQVRVEILERQK